MRREKEQGFRAGGQNTAPQMQIRLDKRSIIREYSSPATSISSVIHIPLISRNGDVSLRI